MPTASRRRKRVGARVAVSNPEPGQGADQAEQEEAPTARVLPYHREMKSV